AWFFDPARREQIKSLGEGVAVAIAKAAAAEIRAARKGTPSRLGGDLGYGFAYRVTRPGRPMDFTAFDFALCCYVTYLLATGAPPTRRVNWESGASYGPFHEFLDAAIGPTGFVKVGSGNRPRVDALVRAV